MENKKNEMTKFEMEHPTILQDKFLRANSKFIAFGGAKGGGKIWAARSKAILMGLNYPGITIAFIGNNSADLKDIANRAENETEGFAKLDGRRTILEFENGSRVLFRTVASKQTHRLGGCEFDIIFILRTELYNTCDVETMTHLCRGNNNYPKRVYYIFDFCDGYVQETFIKGKYGRKINSEDYTLIEMDIEKGCMEWEETSVDNPVETYGA